MRQAKRFLQVASRPRTERYVHWMTNFRPAQKQALYTPEFRAALGNHDGAAWLHDRLGELSRDGRDPLDALLAADMESYLPYDLLVKMDIATMANSLEARSPFLDQRQQNSNSQMRLPDTD